ncbi:galactose-1-phosphate uridylyltransferase [bacterium]|nr:galactose-1-phosphate uridylyltransferase [bacterium]
MSSELRKDPFSDGWIIVSPERSKKPTDFIQKTQELQNSGKKCPFCPGNEDETSVEIRSVGRPQNGSKSEWDLRVVANRFPALKIENSLVLKNLNRVHNQIGGVGAHEVIIESTKHDGELWSFSDEERYKILEVYRERVEDLYRDKRFVYVQIFRNFGEIAGASLVHPHSQLIAVPTIPKRAMEEIKASKHFWETYNNCLFCEKIYENKKINERIICETKNFIALEPFASRFPFETWVLPKNHSSNFSEIKSKDLAELSKILGETLTMLKNALNNPPYNLVIHTSPNSLHTKYENIENFFHWHIEIIPRLSSIAGFEWGTGFYINPVSPEEAAKFLLNSLVRN